MEILAKRWDSFTEIIYSDLFLFNPRKFKDQEIDCSFPIFRIDFYKDFGDWAPLSKFTKVSRIVIADNVSKVVSREPLVSVLSRT